MARKQVELIKQLHRLAEEGLSRREAASQLGISLTRIQYFSNYHSIRFARKDSFRQEAGIGTRNYGHHSSAAMKRIMVPFPDEVAEEIHQRAVEAKTSFAEQVRCLVANALNDHINPRKRVEVEA